MPAIILFDKIITLSVSPLSITLSVINSSFFIIIKILQNRGVLKTNKLIGSFKLDIGTVWSQEGTTGTLQLKTSNFTKHYLLNFRSSVLS